MELLRLLIVIFLVLLVTGAMLKLADAFSSYYENKVKPMVNDTSKQIMGNLGENTTAYNISDYDAFDKTKPYFSLLDITLVIAFLAGLAGAFIYTRKRT